MTAPQDKPRRIGPDNRKPQASVSVASVAHLHRLCWKNDEDEGGLVTVWPCNPDLDIIKTLAVACLPEHLFADAEVSEFSQGNFHRLYSISSTLAPKKYLMRVALPVDPFFKTESEVATIQYVRERSTVPVPHVIAYSSDASNELGFEWMLMEKMEGVSLENIWRGMPLEAKMELAVELAHRMKPLMARRFPRIGNIYFADIADQVCQAEILQAHDLATPPSSPKDRDSDFDGDGRFVIGRAVSNEFHNGKRPLLNPNRGPFDTSRDMMMAKTELTKRCICNLYTVPGTDYYSEIDEDLAEEKFEALQFFDKLTKLLPSVYAATDGPEDAKVLFHSDLASRNVLVDPKTFKLVGLVDWECVGIVPAWEPYKQAIPRFLLSIEITGEIMPLEAYAEDNKDGYYDILADYETTLCRHRYSEIVGDLYDTSVVSMPMAEAKYQLNEDLCGFEWDWELASTRFPTHYENEEFLRAIRQTPGWTTPGNESDNSDEEEMSSSSSTASDLSIPEVSDTASIGSESSNSSLDTLESNRPKMRTITSVPPESRTPELSSPKRTHVETTSLVLAGLVMMVAGFGTSGWNACELPIPEID